MKATKTYQVWAAESVDTGNCNAVTPCTSARITIGPYLHKIEMAYDREEVQWAWLLVVFI